jgi:hypothetical protein
MCPLMRVAARLQLPRCACAQPLEDASRLAEDHPCPLFSRHGVDLVTHSLAAVDLRLQIDLHPSFTSGTSSDEGATWTLVTPRRLPVNHLKLALRLIQYKEPLFIRLDSVKEVGPADECVLDRLIAVGGIIMLGIRDLLKIVAGYAADFRYTGSLKTGVLFNYSTSPDDFRRGNTKAWLEFRKARGTAESYLSAHVSIKSPASIEIDQPASTQIL